MVGCLVGLGLAGGVGAACLVRLGELLTGSCGRERPGSGCCLPGGDLTGEGGFVVREGRTGLGLLGTKVLEDTGARGDGKPLIGGLVGLISPVLKGLLDTSLEVISSGEVMEDARGLEGDGRGGREGGASSAGDTDFTVFTEVLEDNESLLEVMLIFDGLRGDRLVSRSSVDVLALPLNFEAMVRTLWTPAAGFSMISSCEVDFTMLGLALGLALPKVLEWNWPRPGLGTLERGGGGGGASMLSVTFTKGL